ncbi:hypothetical protein ABI244_00545 [Serratia ureilytica]|uniref:hypothetical protein n=1 Tax=Serratia ureilytica TaxID=300181 RepID=UPI002366D7D9|nr:hypothetical protein [Serratia ureilytica]WDF87980.1 hypothetical protein PTZ17_09925 [Serratia ureilytica]
MNNEPAQSLETQLANAKAALTQWEERDLVREDGSMAQDRRHEERGERLRKEVERLSRMQETKK